MDKEGDGKFPFSYPLIWFCVQHGLQLCSKARAEFDCKLSHDFFCKKISAVNITDSRRLMDVLERSGMKSCSLLGGSFLYLKSLETSLQRLILELCNQVQI